MLLYFFFLTFLLYRGVSDESDYESVGALFNPNVVSLTGHDTLYVCLANVPDYFEVSYHNTDNCIIQGSFHDAMKTTGWSYLKVKMIKDRIRNLEESYKAAYAAGLVEGVLTARRIRDFYSNGYPHKKHPMKYLRKLIQQSVEPYIYPADLMDSKKNPDLTEVDLLIRHNFLQIHGLTHGYQLVRQRRYEDFWPDLDFIDMTMLSADGDIDQLIHSVECLDDEDPTKDGCYDRLLKTALGALEGRYVCKLRGYKKKQIKPRTSVSLSPKIPSMDTHCSALVRLADDNLMVGHTTWDTYSKMVRMAKFYDFHYFGVKKHATILAFSSYPGAITSTDDFILSSSGIAIVSTTLQVDDTTKFRKHYKTLKHEIMDFMIALVATQLATSAESWYTTFVGRRLPHKAGYQRLSSTQWLIIDYSRFEQECLVENLKIKNGNVMEYMSAVPSKDDPHKAILVHRKVLRHFPSEILLLIETVPGRTELGDLTEFLSNPSYHYFGLHNQPFLDGTKNALKPQVEDHENDKRDLTFIKFAPNVTDLGDMREIMQYSIKPRRVDGYSIAPRFDFFNSFPYGAIDSKVVDLNLFNSLTFQAISGPSYSRAPPFGWVDSKGHERFDADLWPHYGQPLSWKFEWQTIEYTGIYPLPGIYTQRANKFKNIAD